jgi:hypothetical protein
VPTLTFHERLTDDDVLPATLRTLLGLTDPEDADAVYVGRRQRAVKRPYEVLVEGGSSELRTPGAGTELWAHRYTLRIRRRAMGDAKQAGAEQLRLAKADVQKVVSGLTGTRPWTVELAGDVVGVQASERSVDEAPADRLVIEALVDMTVVTRGNGELEVP